MRTERRRSGDGDGEVEEIRELVWFDVVRRARESG